MRKPLSILGWVVVSVLGAIAISVIALRRGEPINALWLVAAATCCYALGYRFYSAYIASKILALDPNRATPAERLENGRDFLVTNKWVVFGHHFAAIAGPGPLVGPVLAAQFGYLPGTLWVLAGAVFAGCVQDFVILLFSVRRDGKSLTEMAKEETGVLGGFVAYAAVVAILIILLAVVALVVVNALKDSPWGTFTIAMTIPIALLMGLYLRRIRPGKVLEVSALGFVLVLLAIWGGQWVSQSAAMAGVFTFSAATLAVLVIVYAFAASAMPVWLLLAPRDYLSTFVKLGTISLLAVGIVVLHPTLHMPALTRFVDGSGPVFAGKIFPFAFITIACGAISGFHSLISSGTTPKLIARETESRMVGYGAMVAESAVAVMAIIAACVLQPGIYFAVNSPAGIVGATASAATTTISNWGFTVTAADMQALAQAVGEKTLFNRTGGAPAFALGTAHIFSQSLGGSFMAMWYHFAVMFEALFILTVLDAGTRVARFMIQDALGHIYKPLGRTSWYPSILATSALIVATWGFFLWQGLKDPLGGINSLWPLFGIANQLLATVALCVATTILIRMHRARYALVTLAPLTWLVAVTFTASWQKIFDPSPRIGFLAQARVLSTAPPTNATAHLIFNNRLDAVVTAALVSMVALVLIESARQWLKILSGRTNVQTKEAPFVMTRLAEERL
ncbi:MAG TPA: carbon starvation CstA family protein [Candidatus Sulfotelmatobacter sp.]|jgi:carbon starvation protein|nr:carbon starvation CstA family protein [Candidatus Sulfotelmatobacter sp.]